MKTYFEKTFSERLAEIEQQIVDLRKLWPDIDNSAFNFNERIDILRAISKNSQLMTVDLLKLQVLKQEEQLKSDKDS